MPHETSTIASIAAALGIAFALGILAARVKLPPIVGYLAAGFLVGPLAPGLVANEALARQLADVGVILLLFGVGVKFSIEEILEVRRTVVPGAVAQIVITGTLATAIGRLWGWSWGGALVLGLSLGVASTVVLMKALERSDRLDSAEGRVAVGWLVVEDLTMVLALVLFSSFAPTLAGNAGASGATAAPVSGAAVALAVAIALAKVAVFVALMIFVGRKFVPWLLAHVARLGSRELFTLAVLAVALGVGTIASQLFGVSVALGAFFAGAVVSESELSQRAAADALPLQDAFAVLFFVSVGMLFDPAVLVEHPMRVLTLAVLIIGWKSALSFTLLKALGQPTRTAMTVGAGLGQIGEFSFILAGIGLSLGLLPREGQALIVAAALLAIAFNGPVLYLATRFAAEGNQGAPAAAPGGEAGAAEPGARTTAAGEVLLTSVGRTIRMSATLAGVAEGTDYSALADHTVIIGFGRVGTTVAEALQGTGAPYVVVDEQERVVAGLRKRGTPAIHGDATRLDVLTRAGIQHARLLVVTAPEPIRARRIVEVAREANPRLAVAVRTNSAAEQQFYEAAFSAPGARGLAAYAEREAALSLARFALLTTGHAEHETDALVDTMRGRPTMPTETFRALTREMVPRAKVTE